MVRSMIDTLLSEAILKQVTEKAEILDENGNVIEIEDVPEITEVQKENEKLIPAKESVYYGADELGYEEDFHIQKASILSILMKDVEKSKFPMIHVTWLCLSKSNKFFTLGTSYFIEDKMELETILDNPAITDNAFVGFVAASSMISEKYQNYLVDMQFCSSTDKIEDCEDFILDAIWMNEKNEKEAVRFFVPKEVFVGMVYIDEFIYNSELNYNGFELASISGVDTNRPEIFEVIRIEDIISINAIPKSSSVAVEMRVSNGTTNELLLGSFNIGVKLPFLKTLKSKNLQKDYMEDADQYVTILSFNTKIKDKDKSYLVIEGKNKNGKKKLFFLDNGIQKQIENMIKNY